MPDPALCRSSPVQGPVPMSQGLQPRAWEVRHAPQGNPKMGTKQRIHNLSTRERTREGAVVGIFSYQAHF